VSLDRTREPWLEAIQQDGLTWKQVLDDTNKAGTLYNVESIPSTFLIDQEGNIIAQNLRGEALEDKLAEIFGK
jgi:hypothetical protein